MTAEAEPTEADKFKAAMKKIVSTPRSVIEKRDAEWRESRKQKRASGKGSRAS